MTLPKWIEPKVTVSGIIQIAVIVGGGLWTYFTLIGDVAESKKSITEVAAVASGNSAAISTLRDVNAVFNTRIAIVESRAETQAIEASKTSEAIKEIGAIVQGLVVTSATTKTDVGYIRDWIEDQKREARK